MGVLTTSYTSNAQAFWQGEDDQFKNVNASRDKINPGNRTRKLEHLIVVGSGTRMSDAVRKSESTGSRHSCLQRTGRNRSLNGAALTPSDPLYLPALLVMINEVSNLPEGQKKKSENK
eukprot:5135477-Amphidinium_carterae.1